MAESITVTLSDTSEVLTFIYESPFDLTFQYKDNILGANELEGRSETTYWRDPIKREEYRLACLASINNA